ESYSFNTSNRTFEMALSINQNSYDIPVENEEWNLTCRNTEKFDGFFWSVTLPYVKMKILNNHPLLFTFHDNKLECEIIGKPENLSEFIGDISITLEKYTGNWFTVNKLFWNNEKFYRKYSRRNISIPKSLEKCIRVTCEKHNL